MSHQEWILFCNKVDRVLHTVWQSNQEMECFNNVLCAAIFFMFLLFIISASGSHASFDSNGRPVVEGPNPAIVMVFFVLVIGGIMVLGSNAAQKATDVWIKMKRDLQNVLNAESSKRSNVSFHIREQIHQSIVIDGYHSHHSDSGGRGYHTRNTTILYIECYVTTTTTAPSWGGGAVLVMDSSCATTTGAAPGAFGTAAAASPATATATGFEEEQGRMVAGGIGGYDPLPAVAAAVTTTAAIMGRQRVRMSAWAPPAAAGGGGSAAATDSTAADAEMATGVAPVQEEVIEAVEEKSALERLQELEEIRTFISEEDYNQKKNAILASV